MKLTVKLSHFSLKIVKKRIQLFRKEFLNLIFCIRLHMSSRVTSIILKFPMENDFSFSFIWYCIFCYITNCLRSDLMTIMHLWTLHNTDYSWQPESWDPCHNFGGRCRRRKIFVYAKLSLKQQQSCKQYDGYYCYSNSAVITGGHSSIGLLPLLLPRHYIKY